MRPAYMPLVSSPLYSRDILRLAASIPHLGRLAEGVTVEKSASLCGSRVAVDLVVDAAGRVAAIGQEVKACALGQASAALLGAHIIGSDAAALAEARDALASYLAGTSDEPGPWPGLDVFATARSFPARHGAILLPFQAAVEAATLAAREAVRS
jgi:NifU-like protein involved in Fe-S cluster formation